MNKFTDRKNSEDDCLMSQEESKSAKIFMIDDEPIILNVYTEFFSIAGFKNVFAFTDPVEAVETLRYVTPDIILTDINMPEVSGNFLIKLIRTFEHLRTVPIVAITSDVSEESTETTIRKGADSVIHKPLDAITLTECVSKILESTRKLQYQLSEAELREHELSQKKKAALMSVESDLRNMMR